MEVNRAILYLNYHIVVELAIQGHKLVISLLCAVATLRIINKCSPHHDAVVRFQCLCQHICAIGVCAPKIHRTGESLAIGFYEESAKIRYQSIDFVHFLLPPIYNVLVQGVGSLQSAESRRRGEVDGEIHLNIIRTQTVGDSLDVFQHFGRQHLRVGVHIVNDSAVDAHRGIGAGVGLDVGAEVDFSISKPNRASGISALHAAVGIVPMVEDADLEGGAFYDCLSIGVLQYGDFRAEFFHTQKSINAIKRTGRGFGDNRVINTLRGS